MKINKNVVFVKGPKKGALYNLNTGDVYSINEDAVKIIENYDEYKIDHEYLELLKKEGLFDYEYLISEYKAELVKPTLNLVWLEITQSCI